MEEHRKQNKMRKNLQVYKLNCKTISVYNFFILIYAAIKCPWGMQLTDGHS